LFFDVHVHTEEYSLDSQLPLRKILTSAKIMGLSGICITDHNSQAFYSQAESLSEESGLVVIVGLEYSCREGHLLVFGTRELIKSQLPLGVALKQIKSQGGIVIAAHPFRWDSPLMEDAMKEHISDLDGIEAFNGGATMEENLQAYKFADDNGLPIFGGSDAHHEIRVGRFVTEFFAPVKDEADFIRSIIRAKSVRNGLESISVATRKGGRFVPAYLYEKLLHDRIYPPTVHSIKDILNNPGNRFPV